MNHLCHCESYSFDIKLKAIMAKALEESSMYLTPKTLNGDSIEVFWSEWDHLRKILKNKSVSNEVNSATGIMLQEKKLEIEGIQLE